MRLSPIPALVLALLAPPALDAQVAATPADAGLRPGDVVRLTTWRLPEFTGEYRIGSGGEILHPLLSEVRVTGATEAEIRERILGVLRRYETDPQVAMDLLMRVSVMGEVQQPNLYLLPSETTVSQAVASAGGLTRFATLRRVSLLRDGRETVLDLHRPDSDVLALRIRSGDEIRVPRQANVIRDVVVPSATVISAIVAIVTLIRVR